MKTFLYISISYVLWFFSLICSVLLLVPFLFPVAFINSAFSALWMWIVHHELVQKSQAHDKSNSRTNIRMQEAFSRTKRSFQVSLSVAVLSVFLYGLLRFYVSSCYVSEMKKEWFKSDAKK